MQFPPAMNMAEEQEEEKKKKQRKLKKMMKQACCMQVTSVWDHVMYCRS